MNVLNTIANLTPAAGFFLLVSLITFHSVTLKKKGVKLVATQNKITGKTGVIYLLPGVLLLVFITEIFKPLNGFLFLPEVVPSLLFDAVFMRISGILTIFLSVLLMKTTLHHFGYSLRFGLNKSNAGKLVTNGVFAHSRNPFFVSILLFFTGTALIFPNLFFLFFAVSAFAGIHFSILKEEKFMQKVYGEEYIDYKRKVRRYI
jgi:protein-S-isoprenylcysteine O-methyltransferase Ste14